MKVYKSSTGRFITTYQMWNKGKNPSDKRHIWDSEEGWMLRETSAGELVLWTEIDEQDLPDGVEVVQHHPASYPVVQDSRDE